MDTEEEETSPVRPTRMMVLGPFAICLIVANASIGNWASAAAAIILTAAAAFGPAVLRAVALSLAAEPHTPSMTSSEAGLRMSAIACVVLAVGIDSAAVTVGVSMILLVASVMPALTGYLIDGQQERNRTAAPSPAADMPAAPPAPAVFHISSVRF